MTSSVQLPTLLLLGLIAGGTIFIGLPLGRATRLSSSARGALSMVAAGILLFLLIEILGDASSDAAGTLRADLGSGLGLVGATLAGLLLGFVGLVGVEQRLTRTARGMAGAGNPALRLSYMIAAGIGVHNLSEGLAIGQTSAQGKIGLSLGLIVGFALHNATEGFGIVGPSLNASTPGSKAALPWKTLLLLGLIGGGPTVVGTLLGSLWTSPAFNVFVLALAGGAILYVLKELFASVRQSAGQSLLMTAVVVGFALGWGTGLVADLNLGGGDSVAAATSQEVAAAQAARRSTP